ncbi:DUF2059 domain-containing protein [Sphingomonas sp. KR3-1]|uniref:DUF2059 domain-containing protein n=1 Tax=Sphingomonas sp. KR3-1 TaxID=3156611 RepID=UPI0032B523CB
MSLILALALLAAPDPTPEALALGRRLAETGTFSTLIPGVIADEREKLVAKFPELSDADKALLRATADETGKAQTDRLMDAIGRGYAATLSIEDLRALVAFNESPAAQRWRAATPAAMMGAMESVGDPDFQENARKAFCKKTGKACAPR